VVVAGLVFMLRSLRHGFGCAHRFLLDNLSFRSQYLFYELSLRLLTRFLGDLRMADTNRANQTRETISGRATEAVSGQAPAAAHVRKSTLGRRSPTQERSRFTVSTILQAAAEVIASDGFDRASTNRIAARAGVSIGSLYQYFSNKGAILAALLENHRRDVHRVVGHALDRLEDPGTRLDEGFATLFEELHALHREDPCLTRVLAQEVPKHGDDSSADHDDEALIRRVTEILSLRPEVTVPDPTVAAIVTARTVESLTRWLSHSAPPTLDSRAFVDESVRMLTVYLTS
jgi:AcrR family transcriptional regulator